MHSEFIISVGMPGLVKVSPDESWLRKAHSITSPRPTDLDDLPATPLPTFAGEQPCSACG